jgi:hypothetical protein
MEESVLGYGSEWSDEDLAEFMEKIDTSGTDEDGESEDISHAGLLGTWASFYDVLDVLAASECLGVDHEDDLEDSEHSQSRRRCAAFDDV